MKMVPMIVATGGLIATTGAASAQVLNIPDMKFAEHGTGTPSKVFNFDFDLSGADVLGFTISFDFVDQVQGGDSSWASDLEMKITAPSSNVYVVGQSSFNGGDPFGPQTHIWDFDGPIGEESGFYTSTHFFGVAEPQDGTWNFMFAETWDGLVAYNNVTVEIIKVPAPGALALLGMAGLVGRRRRRT